MDENKWISKKGLKDKLDNLIELVEDKETIKEKIVDNIFIQVNPKYNKKYIKNKERVYVIKRKGEVHDVFNGIERLYKRTRIDHNATIIDSLISLGGMKVIFPLLYDIAEGEYSTRFM